MGTLTKNNKGEAPITLTALIRIIFAILLVAMAVGACTKIKNALFNPDSKYENSFKDFVKSINELDKPSDTASISLREQHAIIGFSKESKQWQYHEVSIITKFKPGIHSFIEKPKVSQCNGQACICLCSDISIDEKELSCKELKCESLKEDISDFNLIRFNPFWQRGTFDYWNGGFLFGRSIRDSGFSTNYNGIITKISTESNTLRIQKRKIAGKTLINVCRENMFAEGQNAKFPNLRKEYFGDIDRCIISEFDEAKVLEDLYRNSKDERLIDKKDKILDHAIELYNLFIDKYDKNSQEEEAMYRLIKIYRENNQLEAAKSTFKNLKELYNESTYISELEIINELK